jgi:hypothetical protein
MKPSPPRSHLQLNLPLLQIPASVMPTDKQADLVVALVELLLGAVVEPSDAHSDGGTHEREAHR